MANYLTFELRGTRHAIDACCVEKSFWLPELAPAEDLPDYFVGLLNLQGRVVPVIDLSMRFGHASAGLRTDQSVVVIQADGHRIGILADHLLDVIDQDEADIEPYLHMEGGHAAEHPVIGGLLKQQGQVFIVIDPVQLSRMVHDASDYSGAPGSQLARMEAAMQAADRAILKARAQQLLVVPEATEEAVQWQALVDIGAHHFAVELRSVAEFVHLSQVTPIPCCPSHVIGCINLRGEVVTILDMAPLLLHKTTEPYRDAILIQAGEKRFALAVHKIVDVRPYPLHSINAIRGQAYRQKHCTMVLHDADLTAAVLDIDGLMREGLLEVSDQP